MGWVDEMRSVAEGRFGFVEVGFVEVGFVWRLMRKLEGGDGFEAY